MIDPLVKHSYGLAVPIASALAQRTAEVIVAETGGDMARFASSAKLAALGRAGSRR
jgi:transposase